MEGKPASSGPLAELKYVGSHLNFTNPAYSFFPESIVGEDISCACSCLAYFVQKAKDLEKNKARRPLIEELDPCYLPPDINISFRFFPFILPGVVTSNVQPLIKAFLPRVERAMALCDLFSKHMSFPIQIVSRRYLMEELIPMIYKEEPKPYGPHELALLLVVLGIGCLLDLDLQSYNLESQHYYRLARASLALQSVLTIQSIVTVQVVTRFPSFHHVCHVFDPLLNRFCT